MPIHRAPLWIVHPAQHSPKDCKRERHQYQTQDEKESGAHEDRYPDRDKLAVFLSNFDCVLLANVAENLMATLSRFRLAK